MKPSVELNLLLILLEEYNLPVSQELSSAIKERFRAFSGSTPSSVTTQEDDDLDIALPDNADVTAQNKYILQFCYKLLNHFSALSPTPVLPATTLAPYCYYEMFYGCKALTEVAELPATTAAEYSCSKMFVGCSALKTVSSRLASTLADHCYYYMFADCTALVNAPVLPATTLAPYCYSAMFRGCSSLETAPALPATQLADHCYESMFFNYLNDPYQLKNAPELPATTLADNCYTYMFSGCKSLTTAPDLPAKVLENGCYVCMFNNCTSLTYVKCLATSIASDATTSPTYNWLRSVPASGTFVKDASVDYNTGQFWDTSTQFGSTTKCAAQAVAGWTWKNN